MLEKANEKERVNCVADTMYRINEPISFSMLTVASEIKPLLI